MKISIEAIKKIRELTSAPISQCKTALQQNNGNQEAALNWLKQKGIIQAEKRMNKQAKEGVIGVMVTPCRSKAALVEVNCETDFVAKNSLFLQFVNNLLGKAMEEKQLLSFDKVGESQKIGISAFLQKCQKTSLFPQDTSIQTLQEEHKIVISRMQQNIHIRRLITLNSHNNKYGIYVHQRQFQNVGLQGSIAQFKIEPQLNIRNEQQMAKFSTFADNIATQILGSPPKYLREEDIRKEQIEEQRQKVKKEMELKLSQTPQELHDKIIMGKLNSVFYEQKLLPKMNYILSNDGIPVETYWKDEQTQISKKFNIINAYVWGCK